MQKQICGCVIWYNPTDKDKKNIETYINEIDKLYIIDNSTMSNYDGSNKKIEYINLESNLGIAKALNTACNKALLDGYKWILTMDQDSSFKLGDLKKFIISSKTQYKKDKDIILFAPSIEKQNEDNYVEKVITSGNILNLDYLKKLGGFKEEFFIDEVDFELCMRIRKSNKKIFQSSQVTLNHKIGNPIILNVFGYKITCLNHNYIRKYYITRNRLYMIKKYPELRFNYSKNIVADFFKILLIEKDKLIKITYFFKGIHDYLRGIKYEYKK